MMLLAGDLGGTKTRLGIYGPQAGPDTPLVEDVLPSSRYDGLEDLLRDFLAQHDLAPRRAVFGVAGPVIDGRAEITNLGWIIEERQLAEAFGLDRVHLLNDLAAVAYGLDSLQDHDLLTLQAGTPEPDGIRAIIAPGTGLGQAFLTTDGDRVVAHPSEGGHVDFAPADALQAELLAFLARRLDHVSYERVCSGSGLPNIYSFLKTSGRAPEPAWLGARLRRASDQTPVIIQAALENNALCRQTLELFVAILGAQAGNLALTVLPTGGIFLAGGIPPRITAALVQGSFMAAFKAKGRFSRFMEQIPLRVILNTRVALIGAARYGLGQTNQEVLR